MTKTSPTSVRVRSSACNPPEWMPSSFVSNIRVIAGPWVSIARAHECFDHLKDLLANLTCNCEQPGESRTRSTDQDFALTGRGRGRPFFLFRLRAKADFNLAFCPGGIKKACFFASLIISSVITFRLNRRRALSIDSPGLTLTTAIYLSNQICSKSALNEFLLNTRVRVVVKHAEQTPRTVRN